MATDARFAGLGLVLAIAIAVTLAPSLASAQTIRCRNGVITRGDTTARVRSVCGFPTEESTETVVESVQQAIGDGRSITTSVTRTVVLWTFDFGASRLRQQLVIDNGIVTSIRQLGYGVDRPERVDIE